jgi:hypothetical protein
MALASRQRAVAPMSWVKDSAPAGADETGPLTVLLLTDGTEYRIAVVTDWDMVEDQTAAVEFEWRHARDRFAADLAAARRRFSEHEST